MNAVQCPDQSEIQRLLLGQVSEDEAAAIEQHLLNCERCATLADSLMPAEDITAMLAQAETGVFRTPETAAVEQLIQRVRGMRPPAASRSGDSGVLAAGVPEQTVMGADSGIVSTETLIPNQRQTVAGTDSLTSFLQPAESADEIGRLGAYRILEVLGSGGMGVVFRAEDPQLKRQVALKAMKPSVAANPDAKARFLKEAEATAAIEHDNIVTIYQVSEDHGIPFFAMQFLKGESLQQRLKRTPRLPEKDVVRIGREIATGLQAAHERGLIHRDIKPDNIWLQEGTGRVRIVDFGLVRNSAEDVGITQSGVVLGTPKYMAPEQARGESVDHRCDLFSLGSVLYRMVSGRAPFEGSNLTATLIAVAHEDAKPLSDVAPDVSPQLADLITRLLSKNRDQRPESAAVVAQKLREIEASPSPLPRTSAGDAQQPPKRRTATAMFAGFAAMLLLAVLVIKLRTKDGTVVIELDSAVPVAEVEVDGTSVKFSPDATGRQLTVSVPEGTHELTLKTAEGLSLSTELGEKPVTVAVNSTTKIRAWLEKSNTTQTPDVVTVTNAASGMKSSGKSGEHDASMAASKAEASSVREPEATRAVGADQVNETRRSPTLWPAGPFPAWASKEPRWSIMKESDTIPGVVERPTTFKEIGRWNVDTVQSRGAINVARYSPDGKWLATGSGDGHVRVYDSATMKLYQLLPGIAGQVGACDLSWHPDNQRIAVAADNEKQLRIWKIDGQLLREELAGGETYNTINSVAWTFDGSRLICGGANRLEVRDANGELLKTLVSGEQGPHCSVGGIAVSPDRQRFVAWQYDGARIWKAETFELEATISIPCSNGAGGHRVRWSSKDRISLSTFEKLTICNTDGTVLKEFPTEPLCATAWRPDGETLTVWRWDSYNLNTATGESTPADQRTVISPGVGTVPTAIDWSPDGKRIVLAGGRLVVCKDGITQIEYDSGITGMPISSIGLNPDGTQIASVCHISDDCVRLWSSEGMAHSPMPLNEPLLTAPRIAWSPDGKYVGVTLPQSNHILIGKPGQNFLTISESGASLAWSPDGSQLAAGLTNGHILITDTTGKILHDLETGEVGGVAVGWSKQGTLVAHAGQKLLRVDPASSDSKMSLLTDVPAGPSGDVAVWRPDGKEVFLGYDIHVNVADGVAERIRRASPAVAWAPDASKSLFPMGPFTQLLKPDGGQILSRITNASNTILNGAWSPSGDTIFVGYDQSLLMARNAEDLHVKWSAVMLPEHKSVSFDVGGAVLDGDRETLESQFVYYTADEAGNVTMLAATEFELRTGQEILPVPGRSFDGERGFAIHVGEAWKPAPLDAFIVPGVSRFAFSRPGGVSLVLFVQETGAHIDPSWILAESAKAQEENLKATVIEKEVRKVAGRDAMWMVVEGPGTGSAITGNGPVKTTQHWVAIPRETDVLVALLTSPSGTFQASEELFLKAIETLQLRE